MSSDGTPRNSSPATAAAAAAEERVEEEKVRLESKEEEVAIDAGDAIEWERSPDAAAESALLLAPLIA